VNKKSNQSVISRKEFANNLLHALNQLDVLVQAVFDPLRFQLVSPSGEAIKLDSFYKRYLAGDRDSFVAEICQGLGQSIERPANAGKYDYQVVKTTNGPKIVWQSPSEK
jgi:hypothetical protein